MTLCKANEITGIGIGLCPEAMGLGHILLYSQILWITLADSELFLAVKNIPVPSVIVKATVPLIGIAVPNLPILTVGKKGVKSCLTED